MGYCPVGVAAALAGVTVPPTACEHPFAGGPGHAATGPDSVDSPPGAAPKGRTSGGHARIGHGVADRLGAGRRSVAWPDDGLIGPPSP